MTKEDYIIWQIEQDDKLRNLINTSYISAQMDNIKQMRSLVTHLVTISAAIIGFTIPILGRTELIKNQFTLIGGLFELLIVIVFGFWYLVQILQNENKVLAEQHKKFTDYLDKPREARNQFLSNMSGENLQQWQKEQKVMIEEIQKAPPKKSKPDYALDILFGGFFVALVLIVLSMLNYAIFF